VGRSMITHNVAGIALRGILIGLGLNLLVPALLFVVGFNGQCGFQFLGSGGRTCSFVDALVSGDGLLLVLYGWILFFWWAILIIFLLSILGTYLYYRKK
jgi:hypothetical protein